MLRGNGSPARRLLQSCRHEVLGVNIISTFPDGYYAMVSGTSFSAPVAAATAALVRSMKTTGVTNAIATGAVDIDSKNWTYRDKLGYGRIDMLKAVKPY